MDECFILRLCVRGSQQRGTEASRSERVHSLKIKLILHWISLKNKRATIQLIKQRYKTKQQLLEFIRGKVTVIHSLRVRQLHSLLPMITWSDFKQQAWTCVFITFHNCVIVVAVFGNLYRMKSPNLMWKSHWVFSESQSGSKNNSKELLCVTFQDAWRVRISIKAQCEHTCN